MSRPIQTLLPAMARYRWRYATGGAALLAMIILQQVTPRLTGGLFDRLKAGGASRTEIGQSLLLIIAAAAGAALCRYAWRMAAATAGRLLERDLREAFFRHLTTLPAGFYQRHPTGDLMATATNDLQAVRAVAGEEGLMTLANASLTLVLTLVAMGSTIGPGLSAMALLPLPLLAGAATLVGRWVLLRSRAVQRAYGALAAVTQESVQGIRVVKGFCQEEAGERKFDRANRGYLERTLSMARAQGLMEPTTRLLVGLAYVLALIFPGRAVLRGEISLGAFVSLTMYIDMLVWPMTSMGSVVATVQKGRAAFERVQGILSVPPAQTASGDEPIRGEVRVRNLSFTYPGSHQPALRDVSVALEPGHTLGIVGKTGSGKSTLVSLLVRLFDPPRGTVFIDGTDVLDLPLPALRQSIAFVPQETFLFATTVRENIALAPGQWTREEVSDAARVAQVEQEVLDTVVGERGLTLSGGQRQRIGLSRAVLKRSPILVLDDCLSAVDTRTAAQILDGLRPQTEERATILVSHRVATVSGADHIIVMEDGAIAEEGTHEGLLARQGRYWRMHRRQCLEEALTEAR